MRKFMLILALVVFVCGCSTNEMSNTSTAMTIADATTGANFGPASGILSGLVIVSHCAEAVRNRKKEPVIYQVEDKQQPSHPLYNWAQLCKRRAKILEGGGKLLNIHQTCLTCSRARKAFPRDPQLAKAHGVVLLQVDKRAACEAFTDVMVMGDSSAFLEYCNADGGPKQ